MNWVKTFYTSQNDWFGIYLGAVEDSHHERAALVEAMLPQANQKILELGAGGGQTAIALAMLGHEVTMIELLEESAKYAQLLSDKMDVPVRVIQGDFYEENFEPIFDTVCYFDSFGIGTDADQRRLLQRIASWLKPTGKALIEVGSSTYWGGIAKGKTMDLGDGIRQYDFDVTEARLIDRWWRKSAPEEVVYQSLRCYTPADLALLLEGTGLRIVQIQAGGMVDYEAMEFIPSATIQEAMTYYALLEKNT